MSDRTTFVDFIRRIRAGDEQAAMDLVRQYEPLIRREVRLHLEDQRLGRLLDSMDICQSVMASFFVRTAAGQYDLDQPDQLLKLLVTMARNKLASAARQQQRQRRDFRRQTATGNNLLGRVLDDSPSPSQMASGKELWERFQAGLSEEERSLVELRGQGLAWADIATRLGGKAQARRMQLARALDRVSKNLGLDEDADE